MTARIGKLVWLAGAAVITALLACAGWVGWRTWPRPLGAGLRPLLPRVELAGGKLALEPPSGILVAQIAAGADELTAYLEFEYLRSLKQVDSSRVLLASVETGGGPAYRIFLVMEPNLLAAVPALAELEAGGFIPGFTCEFVDRRVVSDLADQTRLFVAAYSLPVQEKLSQLAPKQLLPAMARFILFKSKMDRRVRERLEAAPAELSFEQARRLAADIVAVARFYSLPLDFFLGIGAMENNYMAAPGDLEHTVWKRRFQPGDIVLARRRRRVLVLNYSMGVWQITRETLRHAHRLYLKDQRDYCLLPERLRPPRRLDFDTLNQDVLTTYAGLLLRSLLDHFSGDVREAVAAYNGGVRHPNERYADGVTAVADYARRILEVAAALNGRAIAETQFLVARRTRPARGPARERQARIEVGNGPEADLLPVSQ